MDIVIEPVGLRDIAERADPRLLGRRAVHDGDRGDIGGEALALCGLIGVLLLADTVAEAEAAGVLRSGGDFLQRAGAGGPRQREDRGDLGLAVFGDVVAIGPVVGVGQLGAEAVGCGGLQGVEIGERDPGVGQQVVHGDVLRRRDELGLALLPELITGSAFRGQRGQLGRLVGLDFLRFAAFGLLIDGQDDALGMGDGQRDHVGGKALALCRLVGVLLLGDAVGKAEAAGDIGSLRNVLGRAGAGVPREQDGSGDLSRAVFVDIILIDAAVLIGERRGEVRGIGRRDGIARAELDPGVCQQAADGRIEVRGDDLFAAVLPVLVADDLGLGQRLQLGEGIGLRHNGGFALVALIDGQNDRLGGLFAAEAEFRRRTGVDQVDDMAVLGFTGATAAAAAHAVIRQPDLIDRVVVFVLIVGVDRVVGRRFRRGVSGRCKGRDQHAGQHGEAQQQNCRTPRGLMEESHVISLLFLKTLSFRENNHIHSSTRSSKCLILCLKN